MNHKTTEFDKIVAFKGLPGMSKLRGHSGLVCAKKNGQFSGMSYRHISAIRN